jgi:hypothetical protein
VSLSDLLVLVAIVVGWIAVQTWLLPRLGVRT